MSRIDEIKGQLEWKRQHAERFKIGALKTACDEIDYLLSYIEGRGVEDVAFTAYNQAIEDAKNAILGEKVDGPYAAATFINAIARKCSPHVYVNRLATTSLRSEVVEAITDMQEGRESHQQWFDHLSNPERKDCQGCEDHAVHIGDAEHHREWIEKYDRVIRLLALVPIVTTPTAGGERCAECGSGLYDNPFHFDPSAGTSGLYRWCVSPAPPEAESKVTPLCPVHQRLEDTNKLECEIGGNNCVACSLNERAELLKLLAPFAAKDGSEDSPTVMRRVVDFYDTHLGENRVVVSYPAATPVPTEAAAQDETPIDLIAWKWANTLSEGEQSVLLGSSIKRLQQMIVEHCAGPSTTTNSAAVEVSDWHEDLKSKIAWHRDGVGPDVPVLQPRYDALRAEVERLNAEVARLTKMNRELAIVVDIGTDDDPGTALSKLHKIQFTARANAIDEAIGAVNAERLHEQLDNESDKGYMLAIAHCVAALESLKRKDSDH